MIVVDYNQTAIGNYMAEVRGRTDVEPNLPILRLSLMPWENGGQIVTKI